MKADINYSLKEEEYSKRTFPLSWLISFFKPYLPQLLTALGMAVIINLASLAGPYITEIVIDDHLGKNSGDMTALIILAAAYFGATLISSVFSYMQEVLVGKVGQKIVFNIRTQLYEKIQRLTLSFFDKNSSGRIFTRLTSDVEAMSDMVSTVLVSLFSDGIMIIGIIVMMIVMSPRVAGYALLVLPVIMISVYIFRVVMRKIFIKIKAALSHLNGFLAESITGFSIIKLFAREKEKNEEFGILTKRHYRLGLAQIVGHTFGGPYMDMLNNLACAFLFYIFAKDIVGGVVEVGIVYGEITYLKKFFDPIVQIIEQYTDIQSALVSGERIYSVFKIDEEEDYTSGERLTSKPKGDIEFRNVTFAYNDDNYVIKNLSFHARAGEHIAFVGATGSGKSTVISLLCRFYKINEGNILLDGKSIYDINLVDLRRYISVIQQEPFLFTSNVMKNITLGDGDITAEDVTNAAHITGADSFISGLNDGYSSSVSERGRTFSQGQRQLISFTRAAVRSPSIFILDEATANIDTETEEHIKSALESASKGITRITVAHRLSTITDSDCIYVLKKGELRESGTHEELIALGGIYKRLYENSINN